jgi:hypothetical protein
MLTDTLVENVKSLKIQPTLLPRTDDQYSIWLIEIRVLIEKGPIY